MSKISTYPSADVPLQLSDRLIGTEAIRPVPSPTPLATKNFSLGELLQLFSSNFPAASLQAVLDTGNTATQNITLIGTIDTTVIKPDNIEDTSGSQGTVFQYLSKGASSINWVDLPVDNLQAVLNTGNTATQSITLVGNITSTKIIPGNIQDEKPSLGNLGQVLTKSATGIVWADNPFVSTPGLADVLSVGNTATNDITLIGDITATSFIKSGGTNLQYLMADGSVTTGGGAQTLQQVTDAGNTTTDDIVVTDGIYYESVITSENIYSKILPTGEFIAITPTVGLVLSSSTFAQTSLFWKVVPTTITQFLLPNDKPAGTYTIATTDDIPTAVTSVGLSMPSAFNVSNSPITGAGVIAVSGAGTSSQYIRGDGQLAAMPSGGGGGSSVNYYLNGSVASSVAGYQQLSNVAIIGGGTDFTRTGNGLIKQFLTDVGNPNRIEIPGGAWNFEMWFSISSSGGNTKFYVELLKYDGSIFTTIASTSAVPEAITGGTNIDLYLTSLAVPTTTLLTTDRLAIRVYIVDNSGGRTVTLHTEDNHLCEILTTFSSGVTSLNGLTANTQYLATGTTGTDFNISSITDTHTFNLPDASATARGLITINGQTLAGAKTFSTAPILSSLTASRLLALDAGKNIQSLDTATYPSLTELSYVKGVTSSIQTQLNKVKTTVRQTPNARYQLDATATWKGWSTDIFFFTALPSANLGTGAEPTLTNINIEQGIITTDVIRVLKNIKFNSFNGLGGFQVEIAIYKSDYNATVQSNVSNIRKIYGGILGTTGPLSTTAQNIILITDTNDTPINHISKYTLYFKNISGSNFLRYYLDWNFENN